MNTYSYYVHYRRYDSEKKLILYAKNENAVISMFPEEVVIISIRKTNQKLDNFIRTVQKALTTERFNQQKIIGLLEMIDAAYNTQGAKLNNIFAENLLFSKPRLLQYEYCELYGQLNSGIALSQAMRNCLRVPSHISGMIEVADKKNNMKLVFKSAIKHFNYLLARSFRLSKLIYIQIFLTLTEAIASHYAAKTKFNDYFFSIEFRGDEPPLLAQAYVYVFKNLDLTNVTTIAIMLLLTVITCRAMYRLVNGFRNMVDWLRLHTPILKQVDYLNCQLSVYRALSIAQDVSISYKDSLHLVKIQIENRALVQRWKKIVNNQENHAMSTMRMVSALIAPSASTVRPEGTAQHITDTDINLLELDLQQRYFTVDMIIIGTGLLIAVAIPLWGVIAYALTQNYYWLKVATL